MDLEQARDQGRDWFVDHSEVSVVVAYRHASKLYDGDSLGKAFVLAFAEGFLQARHRREEWLKEQA